MATMSVSKTIKEICRKPPAHWVGDGFNVFPVFSDRAFTTEFSPFLMFDYAAPKEFPTTSRKLGVGQHPHRGFETVTIAFQGEVEHGDSLGNRGVIKQGDVQWMTAAKGIVHEEFHSREFAKSGGTFEMAQIWVNLPSKHKMVPPRYQPIEAKNIPQVNLFSASCAENEISQDDGNVRVISGEYRGTKGAAETFSPVNMWDVSIKRTDRPFEFDIEQGHNTLVFVRRGQIQIEGKTLNLADVAIMSNTGTKITVTSKSVDTQVLFLSGEPINEPIAARGPFVMNTQKELTEAIQDYQSGRNGFEHF